MASSLARTPLLATPLTARSTGRPVPSIAPRLGARQQVRVARETARALLFPLSHSSTSRLSPGRDTGPEPAPAHIPLIRPSISRTQPLRATVATSQADLPRPEADDALTSVPDAPRTLAPAVLPGTPAKAPFAEEKLIQMAKVRMNGREGRTHQVARDRAVPQADGSTPGPRPAAGALFLNLLSPLHSRR